MAQCPDLEAKYDVLRLGVISSNSISNRTTLLVKHLMQKSSCDKTAIASLQAKASVANKLISAIEIAKRELCKEDRKVYQYSGISFESITIKSAPQNFIPNPVLENGAVDEAAAEDEAEEDGAFETMGSTEKRRDVPILTVFLSLSPVKELRDTYSEQVD